MCTTIESLVESMSAASKISSDCPLVMEIPKGISVSVEGGTKLTIEGIDKQLVGQFTADIRSARPPEPYKGKGIRYADERVRRKVGKTGAV